jgi:hypothetical protein
MGKRNDVETSASVDADDSAIPPIAIGFFAAAFSRL